jgi:hypothetical protein
MGPALAVEGTTDREVFEAYVEKILAPSSLQAEQVVVMDNLSAHKGERVRELVEQRGTELLYLPPYYSPDWTCLGSVDCFRLKTVHGKESNATNEPGIPTRVSPRGYPAG